MEAHYGSEAGTGARQIHEPAPDTLIDVTANPGDPTRVSVDFEVPLPDSRLRAKISLLFVPTAGQTLPATDLEATLYLGAAEYERAGYDGRRVLVTDVMHDAAGAVVHQSAPLVIPEDVGLSGFSQEFVTAADT